MFLKYYYVVLCPCYNYYNLYIIVRLQIGPILYSSGGDILLLGV